MAWTTAIATSVAHVCNVCSPAHESTAQLNANWPNWPKRMQIFVKRNGCRQATLEVDRSGVDSIARIKFLVSERGPWGTLPLAQQVLRQRGPTGPVLHNSHTLSFYDIKHEDTLHLTVLTTEPYPQPGLRPMVPLPGWAARCGPGEGLAACHTLGVVVTEGRGSLSVWDLGAGGLTLRYSLGGADAALPLPPEFGKGWSGRLAFTEDSEGSAAGAEGTPDPVPGVPVLVATDASQDAVHVVDVVGRRHVGYVAAPGSISRPRVVAGSRCLVAVSSLDAVHLFRGSGASWAPARVIAPQAATSLRLARSAGVTVLGVVVDRQSLRCLSTVDGALLRDLLPRHDGSISDVEWREGQWCVARSDSDTVLVVAAGGRVVWCLGGEGTEELGEYYFESPLALAAVRGLGLVVRDCSAGGRLQVLSAPGAAATSVMSRVRVAWMVAVVRGGKAVAARAAAAAAAAAAAGATPHC